MNEKSLVLKIEYDGEFYLSADERLSLNDFLTIRDLIDNHIRTEQNKLAELHNNAILELNRKMDIILKSQVVTINTIKELIGTSE